MRLTRLVPNLFYADINDGLKLFVECLQFSIGYDDLSSEKPFCVVERDGLKVYLIQDAEFAARDRPEIRIETDDIDDVYREVTARGSELLHPNGREVGLRPWGAREFALLDASGVCVVVQQWPSASS